MIYITGDTHRNFSRFDNMNLNKNDIVIVLGDAGVNYFLNEEDVKLKSDLKKYKCTFFFIRGNHEERPENIRNYKISKMFDGKVYVEKDYPYLVFAKDGEIYNINNKSTLVIGGAYSVDKYHRLLYGARWFKDEQLSKDEMDKIYNKVVGKHYDVILTHTCPYKYEPLEVYAEGLRQEGVDKTTEHFLDIIEDKVSYDKWYCGHYHINKEIDKIEFMFENIKEF